KTDGDLRYAYGPAPDGLGAWNHVTVDSAGDVGRYCSLAVVNNHPAISYHDQSFGNLDYAYSATLDGSSGWTALIADPGGDVGWDTSLAVVNGRPAISHWDAINFALKYSYSATPDGSTPGDWSGLTVDNSDGTGRYRSLAVGNNR